MYKQTIFLTRHSHAVRALEKISMARAAFANRGELCLYFARVYSRAPTRQIKRIPHGFACTFIPNGMILRLYAPFSSRAAVVRLMH